MTEEEAKTKMCCGPQIVAVAVLGLAPAGTVEFTPTAGRCIGSECMAWRMQKQQVERRETGLGRMPVEPYERYVSEGWRQLSGRGEHDGLLYERTIAEEAGYCGLAGKP